MPAERNRRTFDPAPEETMAEVLVETSQTFNVDRMLVDPDHLGDRLLSCRPQSEEKALIRVIEQIRAPGDGEAGQTAAFGMRGDESESARPSATRRNTIFMASTYWATDSRASALSG